MQERIARLEAEVDSLLTLAIGAYERFLFLRPMMANDQLNERIASEGKGIGFRQLRNWLYWAFIQELVKICDDKGERTPCIRKLKEKLEDAQTIDALERKYSLRGFPRISGQSEEWWQHEKLREEMELRSEFKNIYRRFQQNSGEMLLSHAKGGYQKVRHKLIAHNELRKSERGYSFFNLKELKLKYGDERVLWENVKSIVDDLNLLVRNADFSWDTFVEQETRNVCEFWEIQTTESP